MSKIIYHVFSMGCVKYILPPNDIKRNIPIASEPSRCSCSSEDFASSIDPESAAVLVTY